MALPHDHDLPDELFAHSFRLGVDVEDVEAGCDAETRVALLVPDCRPGEVAPYVRTVAKRAHQVAGNGVDADVRPLRQIAELDSVRVARAERPVLVAVDVRVRNGVDVE